VLLDGYSPVDVLGIAVCTDSTEVLGLTEGGLKAFEDFFKNIIRTVVLINIFIC
jgi:hypothetical protein